VQEETRPSGGATVGMTAAPPAGDGTGATTGVDVSARRERSKSSGSALLLVLAGIIVLVLVSLATNRGGDAGPAIPADGSMDVPTLGSADAPVVVVEYSDFMCPFCQRHALQVKPRILATYVETGMVRYEWRDLPFQGQPSINAALAARAAQEQGRFWEYHEGLFQRRDEGFDQDNLRRLAGDLGLDLARFDDALASGRHTGLVQADAEEGRALGITGTPAFQINGRWVVGAQPYDVFVEAIEGALADVRA
jgi:protein-disulfide isomerase